MHAAYMERCSISDPPPPPEADPLLTAQQAACESPAGPCVPDVSWPDAETYWQDQAALASAGPGSAKAPWQREMFGAVDAALHVQYAELMGVPTVWEPPPPPPAPAAALQAGVQNMMSKMMEMMSGGQAADGQPVMMTLTPEQMQEMMAVQQQQQQQQHEGAAAGAIAAGGAEASGDEKQQRQKKKKKKQTKTPKTTQKKGKENAKKASCWREDRSGTHQCKLDSDCGVDAASCQQRVCSKYQYCETPE